MASGSWGASSGASKLTRMINSSQAPPSKANLSLRKRRQVSRSEALIDRLAGFCRSSYSSSRAILVCQSNIIQ